MAAAGVAVLAGCGSAGVPDREPEAVGAVAEVSEDSGTVYVLFEPDAGYEYFEGTTFAVGAEVPLEGVDDAGEVAAGDRLEVWTGPCAESFPVQCTVEGVRVLD
ncbi:MAG: hypothetical protein ACK5NO_00855 [Demequina sp.]